MLLLNVDILSTTHDESVADAFRNIDNSSKTIYGTIDRSRGHTEQTKKFIGFADVINWSFSQLEWTKNYNYGDTIQKQAFLAGTAMTQSAGNAANDGYITFNKNGEPTSPEFSAIGILQASPYDFTVGAIKTFDWNENKVIDGRATKVAKFELAEFSEVAPKFVDFFTYGDQGTSFSAPTVAGLISKILQDHPDYTLNDVRTVLERNSKHIEFERDGNKWIAQVLDPYNLENNKVRDGKLGDGVKLFTDGIKRSDYTFTFDTQHKIDKWAKLDGLYEIFLNRNHDQASFEYWMSKDISLVEAIESFSALKTESEPLVGIIERVQALYHVGLDREPTAEETVAVIDYYAANNENFNKVAIDFVGYYNIDLNTLGWD